MTTVYKLLADGEVFYVGITTKSLETRLRGHFLHATSKTTLESRRKERYNELLARGANITIEAIEDVEDSAAKERETWWINHYEKAGCNLGNTTQTSLEVKVEWDDFRRNNHAATLRFWAVVRRMKKLGINIESRVITSHIGDGGILSTCPIHRLTTEVKKFYREHCISSQKTAS